jgi:protein arginine kinase
MAETIGKDAWLRGEGQDADIVISTRVRLARNVEGFALKAKLGGDEEVALVQHLKQRIGRVKLAEKQEFVDLKPLDDVERLVLVERHLISLDHANADSERGVIHDDQGSIALMLNEEDHLRLQVLGSGMCAEEVFDRALAIEDDLQGVVEFAYHSRYGYLTSCPTNVGTGMRLSVMLHLPGLAFTKQIDKVFNAVARMNLAVRGFYGEGTKALSDLYQISNQVTLGKTPEELLNDVRGVIPVILRWEREVRNQVMKADRVGLEDKVWRALGALRSARTMSSSEAFEQLSHVRLGVHCELIPDLTIATLNELFLLCQPGHLQTVVCGGKAIEPRKRDIVRAELLRSRLGGR